MVHLFWRRRKSFSLLTAAAVTSVRSCPAPFAASLQLSEKPHTHCNLHYSHTHTNTREDWMPWGWTRPHLLISDDSFQQLAADMNRVDYGSDMGVLQDLTFCVCLRALVRSRRGFVRWSVWYLFCFRQVSSGCCKRLLSVWNHVFTYIRGRENEQINLILPSSSVFSMYGSVCLSMLLCCFTFVTSSSQCNMLLSTHNLSNNRIVH